MLTEVKDLRKGDEVLYPMSGNFRYFKLLRDPVPRTQKDENGNKIPGYGYKSIKCSSRVDIISTKYSWGTQTYRKWICTAEEHNYESYIDLFQFIFCSHNQSFTYCPFMYYLIS